MLEYMLGLLMWGGQSMEVEPNNIIDGDPELIELFSQEISPNLLRPERNVRQFYTQEDLVRIMLDDLTQSEVEELLGEE